MLLMKEFSETIEPWFCEMSEKLLTDVKGFMEFLFEKLDNMDRQDPNNKEILEKLSQLLQWRDVAKTILSRKSLGLNFVDSLSLECEPFKLLTLKNTGVFVLLNPEEVGCEESKCESSLTTGFIIKKCLRKVRTKNESRDVLAAVRCDFDTVSNQVLKVYDDQQFIIKRVGKILSSQLKTELLRREFKVQRLLSDIGHEGINKLVAYCEDSVSMFAISVRSGNKDLLDSLQQHIELHGTSFCEERVSKLFKPAVEGFLVAHNLGIAHRDISLENLVVKSDLKKEKLEIIDWGHSLSTNSNFVSNPGRLGKERYFSPELLSGSETYDPFKSDVFSLGVCLFSALVGQMPFASVEDNRAQYLKKGPKDLLTFINSNHILSESALDLLEQCLKWEPSERISMREVLAHEFFK